MLGFKLSGLSNNHCLVSFSNTDNYISKCELSNIALLMLCFNFLLVYRCQFGSLNNWANRFLKIVDLKPPTLVGFVSVTE